MSLRRQRLESALKCKIKPKNLLTNENSFEECKQKHKSSIEKLNENREMKFQVLENWEQTKRNAIEKLAAEIEDLQIIEEQIEKRELELQQSGLKVNDEGCKRFCVDSNTSTVVNSLKTKLMRPMKKAKTEEHNTKTKVQTIKLEDKQKTSVLANILNNNDDDMVVIGPNGTQVSKSALYSINWSSSGAAITRKILMEVFDRETLAFHTLTGKPSPAFIDCDKPLKHQLDPAKVADIIHIVTKNLPMTAKDVRSAITTKCADENKMFRQREKKRLSAEADKENRSIRMCS